MNRATLPTLRIAASLMIGLGALLAVGCKNSLYKVKPFSELPPLSSSAASVNTGTLTFRAAPLLTDEETQELFESNLHLAGLLPIRVEIVHNSGDVVELKKLKFRLQDSAGGSWKLISAKQAISRILKANDVFAYNPNSRKQFEKEFREYELDLKTPLSGGRRQGLIIFQTAKKDPVESPRGLVLSVDGVAQPVSLNLN
jgi:hypothetical protein